MKQIKLTQNPYICGPADLQVDMDGNLYKDNWYEAQAEDDEGCLYMVRWKVLDSYEIGEDEGDACDWNNPYEVCMYEPETIDVTGKVEIVF